MTIDYTIALWDPPKEPRCSNCRHCVVFGTPGNPDVRCAAGQSAATRSLWQLIRLKNPSGFRKAAYCPSYDSMSDEAA